MDNTYQRLSLQDPQLLKGKKVLLRVDFNVPLKDGKILDDSRIKAAVHTVKFLHERGCCVVIISHLGRPKGRVVESLRLDPVAVRLAELTGLPVQKADDCIGSEVQDMKKNLQPGDILLLENTRFHLREIQNMVSFSRDLADQMDCFVQDAFGCVHRAHASTEGVTHFLHSMMGFLLEKEFEALKKVFVDRKKPLTLVIGGAKIDTKIGVIQNFISLADNILIGGGLANTFFNAKGYDVKDSLVELDKADLARQILQDAGEESCRIVLPQDFIVSKDIAQTAQTRTVNRKNSERMMAGEKILDIGPESIKTFEEIIAGSQTIIWNGPVGLFEFTPFAAGTKAVGEAIEKSTNLTIAGGGDSVDAIHRFDLKEIHFSHISTGGGAMLEFLEGKMLPGISALKIPVGL